jgi:hypothetical protein
MMIVGQFRDRERPDRFVWIRGFSDMRSRQAGSGELRLRGYDEKAV